MPAISGQAILRELLGNHKRQTIVLPFTITARHGDNVGVSHVLKTLRRERRANSSGAVDHNRRLPFRNGLFNTDLKKSSGQEDSLRQMSLVPLFLFTDVE